MLTNNREPFPALLQPNFGYVADKGSGVVVHSEVQYVVRLDDGRAVDILPRDLLSDSGAKADLIAAQLFLSGLTEEILPWLRGRLSLLEVPGTPRSISVYLVRVTIDDKLRRSDAEPVELATLSLVEGGADR